MRSNALLELRDGVTILNPIELQGVNTSIAKEEEEEEEQAIGSRHMQRIDRVVSCTSLAVLSGLQSIRGYRAAAIKAPEMLG